MVQEGPGIKGDPISKITKAKKAGRVAQVVECLPCKCKALSSNTRTKRKEFNEGFNEGPGV
jgi:hypothetical protein